MATTQSGMSFWLFVGLVLTVVVLWKFLASAKRAPTASAPQKAAPLRQPTQADTYEINGSGRYEIGAVGESHYQPALRSIVADQKGYVTLEVQATLYCEDDNKFDALAVRVDVYGRPVGHLSRHVARLYRNKLAAAGHGKATGRCRAKVCGGGKDKPSYGVWLDI
jgi:hypothetical protein